VRSHAKASSAGLTQCQAGRRFGAGLLAAGLILLVFAASAAAFTTRLKTASFGPDGTSGTSFGFPNKLAFDQANDRLYALDLSPSTKAHAFTAPALTPAGGSFPLALTGSSIHNGIGVDNTGGASASNIYYATNSTREVFGFDSDGSPLGGNFPITVPQGPGLGELCGAAVDSAGNLYVSDKSLKPAAIRKYDSLGNPLGTIDVSFATGVCDIAFDSNDDMFVSSEANVVGFAGGVWKLSAPGYAAGTKIDFSPTETIAVDTSVHHLYVVHSSGVSAYKTDGTFLYDFADANPDAGLRGITVDQGTDQIYVSDTASGVGKVYVFGAAQDFAEATASLAPATDITDTSAELGATITDNSALVTKWRIELSGDGGLNWKTVSSGKTTGGQSGVAVSGTASGLTPNSSYRFRIVTNKGSDSFSEITSTHLFFKTIAPPPVVSAVGAVGVTDISARLAGTIDPRNTEAGYVFEYGTTPALGSSTAPLDIGGGTAPITVSQLIDGLSPDTTYYFRLVATNLTGTTTSVSRTFNTRLDPLPLPANRGYEQVTPPDKNYTDAENSAAGFFEEGRAAVSLDGNAIGFCTTGLFGEPSGRMTVYCAPYLSRRTAGGWQTGSPFPDFCHVDPESGHPEGIMTVYPSADFSRFVVRKPESPGCPIPPLDPAAPLFPGGPVLNLYRQDFGTDPFNFDLLNQQTEQSSDFSSFRFFGGSDDFNHVVYQSAINQTPDSPVGNLEKVYEWTDGSLHLISKDPTNEPFTTSSAPPVMEAHGPRPTRSNPTAISSDGERIYFNNPTVANNGCSFSDDCELYMRENTATTFHVSASECAVSCGPNLGDLFDSATPAGDVAFFRSCSKLTDASSPAGVCSHVTDAEFKLYRWDRNAPPGNRLTDLSEDHEPSDGIQPRVPFQNLIGHSADGNIAYFVATGQIVSGQPTFPSTGAIFSTASVKSAKLYRWRWNGGNPSVDYLGPFDGVTSGADYEIELNTERMRNPVTPDGKYLLIYSRLAYDPTADRDTDADAYRWDEQNGWVCLSCQLPGASSNGDVELRDAWLYELLNGFLTEISSTEPRFFISEDGQRVFFGTPDALVPEDINGEAECPLVAVAGTGGELGPIPACMDVYEWHDGAVNLISSGISEHPARLMFSTRSGRDVFFYTRERLVGWDVDNNEDIYDARIDGGFPEPPAQQPSCEGEGCRGAGTEAPPSTGAATAVFQGPGNSRSQSPEGCPKGKREVRRRGKVRCVAKQGKRRGKRAQRRAANRDRRIGR
jgi:hypothetical protein